MTLEDEQYISQYFTWGKKPNLSMTTLKETSCDNKNV